MSLPSNDRQKTNSSVVPSKQSGTKPARLLLSPRGLNRVTAAAYVGVSATTFDKLVLDGSMPSPIAIRSRKVWDRFELDAAFEYLVETSASTERNEWDE